MIFVMLSLMFNLIPINLLLKNRLIDIPNRPIARLFTLRCYLDGTVCLYLNYIALNDFFCLYKIK